MDVTHGLRYSDGSIPKIPALTSEIWRYTDFGKFVSMLVNGALYFSVLAAFDDQLEAALPSLPEGNNEREKLIRWRWWNTCRCITFASCWHSASDESATMWKIYAGRHEGIAIRSSLQSLSDSFPTGEKEDHGQLVKAGLVTYIDPDSTAHMPSQLDADNEVLLKRKWYAAEDELRVWTIESRNWTQPSLAFQPGTYKAKGMWVDCKLHTLINEVVIAPTAATYILPAVREVLRRFDFNPDLVRPSKLNQTVLPPNPALITEEWQRSSQGIPSAD